MLKLSIKKAAEASQQLQTREFDEHSLQNTRENYQRTHNSTLNFSLNELFYENNIIKKRNIHCV